jgi:delta24-sterol reductase
VREAIPLPEYLFRYDRGGFWVGAAAFDYFPGVPFNSWTRWFLDDFLHTRMLYKALHASGQTEHLIVQDLALPYDTAKEFVDFTDAETGIYPLWLCPLKQSARPTMHPHSNDVVKTGEQPKNMLNIGLWGRAPPTHDAFIRANREIEQKLLELGGMKWLYAQTYYSEEEFWSQFDKPWYDALRAKYQAKGLPDVYEKVKVSDGELGEKKKGWLDVWPLSGLNGLVKATQSKEYLKHREAGWKEWVPRS